MAKIKNIEINKDNSNITFICSELEIGQFNFGNKYNFFNYEDLKDKIKILYRGKDDRTTYLLISKEIKEKLNKNKFEKNTFLDCGIIDKNNEKFLIIRL